MEITYILSLFWKLAYRLEVWPTADELLAYGDYYVSSKRKEEEE